MRIPIQINEHSAEPLYHQIETQLRSLIITGQVEEGTMLPSIREFASGLNCSVITVRRVYQDLENEGLLRTRQGTGTFVAGVGEEARQQFKQDAVLQALEGAVNTALSVHCSEQELRVLFEAMLQQKYQGKGGEG